MTTAPDKIWVNWEPSEGMNGRVSVEAITVLAYSDTMPYPNEYTRTASIPTDARMVTVAQLERWIAYTSEHGGAANCLKEIRAIIGENGNG